MENKKKELLLEKHVDFIANYGKTHDVYVRMRFWDVSEGK
jgi:hypothetical protein